MNCYQFLMLVPVGHFLQFASHEDYASLGEVWARIVECPSCRRGQ